MTRLQRRMWCTGMLAAVAGVWLAGCFEPAARGPAARDETSLTLLCSGEMNSMLEPCRCSPRQLGGIIRRAALVKSIADQQPNVLVLDNGDLMATIGRQEELKFETAILAMNRMAYAALGVGEEDLAMGVDYLLSMREVATFPFLCANLLRDGKPPFASSHIRKLKTPAGELSVAILGVLSPKFSERLKRVDPQLRVMPLGSDFGALVKDLDRTSQVVVALAHMTLGEATRLAKQFPELDIIICGHGVDEPATKPKKVGKTVIVSTGAKGRYVVRLDMAFRAKGDMRLVKYEAIRLRPELPESQEVAAMFDEYVSIVKAENLLGKRPKSNPPAGGAYVGTPGCKNCHLIPYEVWTGSAHSKAYETLQHVTPKRDYDPECVGCHVVGYPHRTGFESIEKTPGLAGVGCENCHGPGADHVKETHKPYHRSSERECLVCHTPEQSPQFDFRKHFPKIKH